MHLLLFREFPRVPWFSTFGLGLLKESLRFFEEALAERVHIRVTQSREFLKLLPLRCIKMRRHLDVHANVQVAVAVPLDISNAFALEPEN